MATQAAEAKTSKQVSVLQVQCFWHLLRVKMGLYKVGL